MKGEKHRELSTKEIYRCVRGAPCQILVTARWLGKAVCPKRWSTQRINGPWMAHELHNKWHINCTGEPKETFFRMTYLHCHLDIVVWGSRNMGGAKSYSIQPILGLCDTEISGSQGIPSSYDHLGSWERLAHVWSTYWEDYVIMLLQLQRNELCRWPRIFDVMPPCGNSWPTRLT